MSSLFTSFALGSVTMSAMRGRAVSSNWRLSWVGTSWAKRPQKSRYDPARRTPTTVVNSNIMRIRRAFAFIPAFPGGSRRHERYESASTIDVDFHQICLAVEVAIPHMLDNFAACDQLGSAQQEKLEQREFLRGKRNYFMATRGASPV